MQDKCNGQKQAGYPWLGQISYDRGYKVTFIEDATGTVNNEETYEMPGLDIRDFVGTALHWSNVIEVLDYEEYVEVYK